MAVSKGAGPGSQFTPLVGNRSTTQTIMGLENGTTFYGTFTIPYFPKRQTQPPHTHTHNPSPTKKMKTILLTLCLVLYAKPTLASSTTHTPSWACNRVTMCVPGLPHICTENVCERGSVKTSTSYTRALESHWVSILDSPVTTAPVVTTHNSALTPPDGYGLWDNALAAAFPFSTSVRTFNQNLSLLDQVVALGATQVELDVHYHTGGLRLCHAGGLHSPFIDAVVKLASKVLGIPIDWDTETIGCFGVASGPGPRERTFADGLADIAAGIRAHPGFFYFVYLDLEPDLESWGKVGDLVREATTPFGDLLLKPNETWLRPNTTYRELLEHGHRLAYVSRVAFREAEGVFFHKGPSSLWPGGWVEASPKKACGSTCGFTRSLPAETILRIVPDACVYGPFFNGSAHKGVTSPLACAECGSSFPGADLATPDTFYDLLSRSAPR